MAASLYAYPWNIHDPRRDVARVQALGIDQISLAASYHAGKFIQPRDLAARVYFPEDGTIYFRPQLRAYGRLRPAVASITSRADVLRALTARNDVEINAWLVLNHNTRLGLEHPDVTVRNCFGDAYVYSMCPSHPCVRQYCIALASDVADNYAIASVLLESAGYLAYAHGFHHEFAQVAPNVWLEAMLALCFCEHCRSGAAAEGVDAEALARRLCRAIDEYLAADAEMNAVQAVARLAEWNATDPDLGRLHAWRAKVVTALVAEIRAAVRPAVRVKVISTTQRPHDMTYIEGGDLAALHGASDGLEAPLYQPDPAAVERDLCHVLSRTGGPERLGVILRPGFPDIASEAQLAETIQRVRAHGIGNLAFYNYGLLRPANLEWLRRCLAET